MRLTILRHAVAVARTEWDGDDADRPLTKDGIARATRLLMQTRGLHRADEIWTSPWRRARATAELAAQLWKLPLTEVPWLAGGAATARERSTHLRSALDVVLVGHEPDLGELIGYLTGNTRIGLAKAGLAVLKGAPVAGKMDLHVLLTPKTVETLVDEDW